MTLTLEPDRHSGVFWVIRRDGEAVKRGRGRLRGWLWLAWYRRREP